MPAPVLADRSAWRRRTNAGGPWEKVLDLPHCTPGDIWQALHRQLFLMADPQGSPHEDEWEYAITLAGQSPDATEGRHFPALSPRYADRSLRPGGRR